MQDSWFLLRQHLLLLGGADENLHNFLMFLKISTTRLRARSAMVYAASKHSRDKLSCESASENRLRSAPPSSLETTVGWRYISSSNDLSPMYGDDGMAHSDWLASTI